MLHRTAAALAALALLALAPRAGGADAAPRWRIGRTPAVFDPAQEGLATRVGGWFDASYEDNDLPDSTRSINLNHLNLFVDTRAQDTWQLFAEVEFENESALTGFEEEREYEVEQLYARYRASDALQARIGQFNTPFGYWTPIHWSILMDTIRPPLHESARITPEQQQGLELSGRWQPHRPWDRDAELRYTAYLGWGDDSAAFDGTGSEELSGGADLRLSFPSRFVGVSYYQQRRRRTQDERSERSVVLYGETALPANLLARAEYVRQLRDRHARPYTRHADIGYASLRWRFHDMGYLSYRFDAGDDDTGVRSGKRRAQTLTLGVLPRPSIRIKLEYADHDFRDAGREDFRFWGVSVGSLF